jgi:hypothetical protein
LRLELEWVPIQGRYQQREHLGESCSDLLVRQTEKISYFCLGR